MGNVPEQGAGAAGRQPHRRQHVARGDRAAARLLAPTSASSGRFYQLAHNLVLASPARPVPAPLRHDGRLPQHAERGARGGRGGARLPRRRLGGPPPVVGAQQDRLRRPQGVHQAGAGRRRADRPGGHDRRPGDRALPQPRRLAGEAHSASTASAAQGAADLARAALGPQRRRPARPPPAAGEDHDRGPGRRSTCASSSAPSPTSTRSTTTSPA